MSKYPRVIALLMCIALSYLLGLPVIGCGGGDGDGDGDADIEGDIDWNVDLSMHAQSSWEICVGTTGVCTDDCCPQTYRRSITTEDVGNCEVQRVGSSYRLSFQIASDIDTRPALLAENLVFENLSSTNVLVSACDRFRITDDGTNYPTTSCVELDEETTLRTGDCALEVRVGSGNTVSGSFQCYELPQSGQFLTTIYNQAPGIGEFMISGCRFNR